MVRPVLFVTAALLVNAAFLFNALIPEYVTFAPITPEGVAPDDLIGAAEYGRDQVIAVLRQRDIWLFILAAANVALVLVAMKRVARK